MNEFFDDYLWDFVRTHLVATYLFCVFLAFLLLLACDNLFLDGIVMQTVRIGCDKVVQWFSSPLEWSYDKFARYVENWS